MICKFETYSATLCRFQRLAIQLTVTFENKSKVFLLSCNQIPQIQFIKNYL
ncbi:hypothetical protein [Porphyromonas endodontalis]|uniref:hypothetical protein n=1 Tax=Porphyromonas endodontalis TaxID=28124 RepID=UPI0023F580B3|nr:hypothetical protein [Porphyromonas endodontalis]